MSEQMKHWLTSKTVWAAILGVLVQLLQVLDIHVLDSIDVQAFGGHMADIVSAVLFMLAGVFRATATAKLTK